jgi:hypothetical protein
VSAVAAIGGPSSRSVAAMRSGPSALGARAVQKEHALVHRDAEQHGDHERAVRVQRDAEQAHEEQHRRHLARDDERREQHVARAPQRGRERDHHQQAGHERDPRDVVGQRLAQGGLQPRVPGEHGALVRLADRRLDVVDRARHVARPHVDADEVLALVLAEVPRHQDRRRLPAEGVQIDQGLRRLAHRGERVLEPVHREPRLREGAREVVRLRREIERVARGEALALRAGRGGEGRERVHRLHVGREGGEPLHQPVAARAGRVEIAIAHEHDPLPALSAERLEHLLLHTERLQLLRADGHDGLGERRPPAGREGGERRHRDERAHRGAGPRAGEPREHARPARGLRGRGLAALQVTADLGRHEDDRDRGEHLAGRAQDAELPHRADVAHRERGERGARGGRREQHRARRPPASEGRGLRGRVPLAASLQEGRIHVHARVHADPDDDRHERDGDRREPAGQGGRAPRGPDRPEGQRRHHRGERAHAPEEQREDDRREDHRERSGDRQIARQHHLRGGRDRVAAREPEPHVRVRRAQRIDHAVHVGHEGARVLSAEGLTAGLHEHEARLPVVGRERAVGLGADAGPDVGAFEYNLCEAQRILLQDVRHRARSRRQQHRARLGEAGAHALRGEHPREPLAAAGVGVAPREHRIEGVRRVDPVRGLLDAGAGAQILRDLRRELRRLLGAIGLDHDDAEITPAEAAHVPLHRGRVAAVRQQRGDVRIEPEAQGDRDERGDREHDQRRVREESGAARHRGAACHNMRAVPLAPRMQDSAA